MCTFLFCRWFAIALLCTGLWLSAPSHAFAQTVAQPQTCRLGAYLVGLHDFDLAKKSFNSDFWVWSVCPSKDLKPLESMDFIDSKKIVLSNSSLLERKDKFGGFSKQDSVYWAQKKVNGDFYHNWDVQNFPFDHHTLSIPIEESVYDTTAFVYTPDTKNSGYKSNLDLDDWKITSFSIKGEPITYNTTYGDPEIEKGQSTYSRSTILINIQRKTALSFLKLNAVVYIGFLLSLASYFLNPAQTSLMGAKISAPVGAIFAVVVNQRATETLLGRSESLTLVDKVHITALLYILLAIVIAIYSRLVSERGDEKRAVRINHASAYIAAVSFVLVNAILITHAAIAG
ncbi:MAG: hypothetical protein ACAF41_03650 [Leptolyngbya sp. BL-A-14]